MTERENLYAAICAAPRDDLPKLVFADWLDEHGDATDRAHAELIHIQCEWEANARGNERALEPYRIDEGGELLLDAGKLVKVDPDAGRALTLLQRAAQIQPSMAGKSRQPLRQVDGASYRYSNRIRAMRTALGITMESTWETRIGEIAAGFPVRDLILAAPLGTRFEPWDHRSFDPGILSNLESFSTETFPLSALAVSIIGSPALNNLKRLKTRRSYHQNELLGILERCDHFTGLESIDIDRFSASSSGIGDVFNRFHENIVRSLRRLRVGYENWDRLFPSLPLLLQFSGQENVLEELDVSEFSDTDDAARLMGRGDIGLRSLVKLSMPNGGLTARGASDLLTSASLPLLRQLDVNGNVLGDLVGKRLEMSTDHPKLQSLDAGSAHLTADGIAALTRWPGFAGLRKLRHSRNDFNHTSMRALTSADAPNLRTLGLANCGLRGSHIRELVTSTFVRSLWSLDLRGNPFDDAAAKALAESPFLDAMQCLYLDLPDDDPSLPRLRERFGERLQLGS